MKVLCLGDSHTWYFQFDGYHIRTFGDRAGPRVLAQPLMAASAAGFAKGPESRFAYGAAKKVALETDFDQLCYSFGQVDAEAGVYFGRYVLGRDETDEAYFTRVYGAYLDQCDAFAEGKPYVVKGLNTSCLIDDASVLAQVFNMITRRVSNATEREEILNKLEDAGLTVASHAERNAVANDVLMDIARKRKVRAFDIRADVESKEVRGLTDVVHLPQTVDIHLAKT